MRASELAEALAARVGMIDGSGSSGDATKKVCPEITCYSTTGMGAVSGQQGPFRPASQEGARLGRFGGCIT